jgi:hypothetical protein
MHPPLMLTSAPSVTQAATCVRNLLMEGALLPAPTLFCPVNEMFSSSALQPSCSCVAVAQLFVLSTPRRADHSKIVKHTTGQHCCRQMV